MYRDDEAARTERSIALIDQIAELERQKVLHAVTDHRLEAARRELATLQSHAPADPQGPPGIFTHLLVFGATAVAAFVGYSLLL